MNGDVVREKKEEGIEGFAPGLSGGKGKEGLPRQKWAGEGKSAWKQAVSRSAARAGKLLRCDLPVR